MHLTTKLKDQLNLKVEDTTYNIITYIDYFLNSISKTYDTNKVSKGLILNEIILKSYYGEPVAYVFKNIKYTIHDIFDICKSLDEFIYDFVCNDDYINKEISNMKLYIENSDIINTNDAKDIEDIENQFGMKKYQIVTLQWLHYNIKKSNMENNENLESYISQIMHYSIVNLKNKKEPKFPYAYNSVFKLYNDFKDVCFIQKLIYVIFEDKYLGDFNYPNINKWMDNLIYFKNNI